MPRSPQRERCGVVMWLQQGRERVACLIQVDATCYFWVHGYFLALLGASARAALAPRGYSSGHTELAAGGLHRGAAHQAVDALFLRLEGCELFSREPAISGNLDFEGIDVELVDQHLVVQMRTRRETG